MKKPTVVKHARIKYPLTLAQIEWVMGLIADFHVHLTEPDLPLEDRIAKVHQLVDSYNHNLDGFYDLVDKETSR